MSTSGIDHNRQRQSCRANKKPRKTWLPSKHLITDTASQTLHTLFTPFLHQLFEPQRKLHLPWLAAQCQRSTSCRTANSTCRPIAMNTQSQCQWIGCLNGNHSYLMRLKWSLPGEFATWCRFLCECVFMEIFSVSTVFHRIFRSNIIILYFFLYSLGATGDPWQKICCFWNWWLLKYTNLKPSPSPTRSSQ